MQFRLEQLGPNYLKQVQPACAVCGYDASHILALGEDGKKIERHFCERDLRDALLDAMNFSTAVPDALP